jgi:hypothetical protein
MVDTECLSPFDAPNPKFVFIEPFTGSALKTVGELLRDLATFAHYFAHPAELFVGLEDLPDVRRRVLWARDANANEARRRYEANPAIQRVREYALTQYGEELTLGTLRRFVGDLMQKCAITVDAAEGLTLEAAVDALDAARNGKLVTSKRSTQKGEAECKIISGLSEHHGYDESGGCTNPTPIKVNEFARKYQVSSGSVSQFLTRYFGARGNYIALCRSPGGLAEKLKDLRRERGERHTFGRAPTPEGYKGGQRRRVKPAPRHDPDGED